MSRHGILGGLLLACAFAFYLHGTAPSVSVGDSGEFITAAHTLGIPHPPGFPTYTLLAKTASLLIPFGNPAYRINLFSTLMGALSIWLLFEAARAAALVPFASLAGALLFMSSSALATSSQGSEVFALHAVFIAGVVLAALRRRWPLAVFLVALGFGNHQTVILLLPGLCFSSFMDPLPPCGGALPAGRQGQGWGVRSTTASPPSPPSPIKGEGAYKRASLFLGLMGLLVALSVYVFPYLRAAHHPALNIGQPDTLERLWRLMTRADYGTLTLALGQAPERTVGNAIRLLQRFGAGWIAQVGWGGVLAGGLGLWYWRREGRRLALILTSFILFGPFFFWLGNLSFDAQSQGVLERFQVAPALCWSVLAAAGFQFLWERSKWLSWAMALFVVGILFPSVYASSSRHEMRAYAYGRNNLRSLRPDAVFLMDGGDDTFYTTVYLTQVEHRRSDIEFHDRGGVVFPGLYGPDFRRLGAQKEARRQTIEQTLAQGPRPLYYSTMNPGILEGQPLQGQGLLYGAPRVLPPSSLFWEVYDLRDIAPWMAASRERIGPYRLRALAPYYAYQRGVAAARQGHISEGVAFLQSAQAIGPDVLWLTPNLRAVLHVWAFNAFRKADFSQASRIYDLLLRWDPADATAWSNHGAIMDREGRFSDALNDYEQAVRLDPQSPSAHFNLAAAFWRQARWREAAAHLRTVVALKPDYPRAQAFLLQAQAKANDLR